MDSIIGNIITALAIGAVIALANKASASAPLKTEAGDDLFKMPNLYRYLGFILIALGLIMIGLSIHDYKPGDWSLILFFFLFFFGSGGFMVFHQRRVEFRLTDEAVTKRTVFNKLIEIPLNEITSIKFSKFSQQLTIRSANKKIICHQHVVGFFAMVDKLKNKTGITDIKIPTNNM